jgi:hypothetical protein
VQGLATSSSIFATEPIVRDPETASMLASAGLQPMPQRHSLRGISEELTVYEIP